MLLVPGRGGLPYGAVHVPNASMSSQFTSVGRNWKRMPMSTVLARALAPMQINSKGINSKQPVGSPPKLSLRASTPVFDNRKRVLSPPSSPIQLQRHVQGISVVSPGKGGSLSLFGLLRPQVSSADLASLVGPLGSVVQSNFNYSVIHPITGTQMRGLRGNPDNVDWANQLTRTQYLHRMEADTQALVFNAVVSNTHATYSSAQKPYLRWCMICGTDPILSFIPPEWIATEPHTHSFRIAVLAGFVSYLCNDNEGKPISAASAGTYLSAARKLLEDSGVDVSFMKDNPTLKSVRKGLKNEWVAIPGHSKADTSTYPVTIDMIESAEKELLDIDHCLEDQGVYTVSVISYDRFCRTSEIVKCDATSHHLRAEAVQFVVMPLGEVFTGTLPKKLVYVSGCDVWQIPAERIAGDNLFIVNSKNDKYGRGQSNPHTRVLNPPSTSVYERTMLLYKWAIRARPLRGEPFFSSSFGDKIVIGRNQLTKWYNGIADMYGLDRSRVNTHSTRYAGASTAKAANFDDSVIKEMGRWDSLAFLRYIRLSIGTHLRVSEALCNRNTFTSSDVLHLSSRAASSL